MAWSNLQQLYFHLEYLGIPKAYKWQNTNNIVGFPYIKEY